MKNIFKIAAALLLIVAALTGCPNLVNAPQLANSGPDGTLIVQIGGEERTLAPSGTDLAGLSYTLLIRSTSDEKLVHNGSFDAASPKEYKLTSGNYAIAAEAYDSGKNLIASITKTVSIRAGETYKANLTLTPVYTEDVPGTFKYSISYPDSNAVDFGYSSATLSLTPSSPNSGSPISINLLSNPEKNPGELALPPGVYTMAVSIASTRQINSRALAVNRSEIVYIYPRLTTNASYTFVASDFTASVRLAGRAEVRKYDNATINSNYVPKEVYVTLHNKSEEKGVITKNAATGDYEWELFVPSQSLNQDNLTSASLRFKAEHATDTTRTPLYSLPQPASLANVQGNAAIVLSARTTTLTFNDASLPGTGGVVAFNPDVVVSGEATITITNPANYGLNANTVRVNGNYLSYDDIVSQSGKVTVTAAMPTTENPQLYASFFHLKGTITIFSNTDSFEPTNIEAFADPVTVGGPVTSIASATSFTGAGPWDFEIPIPAGYVWKQAAASTQFRLVTSLAAASQPAQTSTYTGNITSYQIDANSVSIYISLYTVQNVRAAQTALDTVKIEWDKAEWAANGYNVYDGGTLLATVPSADTISYNYTGRSIGSNSNISVRGIKSDNSEGNTSNTAYITVKQLPPASFTAEYNTSNGFLSNVQLTWSDVSTTNPSFDGYYIQRYNKTYSYWDIVTTIYTNTTTYTDTDMPRVNNDDIRYRIIVRDYNSSSYNSDALEFSSVITAPEANTLWVNGGMYSGSITKSAPRQVYYLSSASSYYYVRAYFYDVNWQYYGDESLDAQFDVYSGSTGALLGSYDDANGNTIVSNYASLIIVVKPASSGDTGTFRLRVDY